MGVENDLVFVLMIHTNSWMYIFFCFIFPTTDNILTTIIIITIIKVPQPSKSYQVQIHHKQAKKKKISQSIDLT